MGLTDLLHPLTILGFTIGGLTAIAVFAGMHLPVEGIFTFVATPMVIFGTYLESRDGS